MLGDSICTSAASNEAVRVVLDPGRVGSDTTEPGWSLQRLPAGFRWLESLRGRPGARPALHRHLRRRSRPRARARLWSWDGTSPSRCLQANQGQPSRLEREMTGGTGEDFSPYHPPSFGRATLCAARSCMPQRLRPWPAQTTADRCASAGRSVRLTRTHRKRSRTTTAGGVEARSTFPYIPNYHAGKTVGCERPS